MAKDRGKKSRRKGKRIDQPKAKIKKMKDPTEITASEPENNNGFVQKEGEKAKRLSGFIFMCNSSTKLECYQYRVFGLPSGKKEVVEEIKPGTKLFLFDFEKKLLYGIYVATSAGNLNLEPSAFRGKFPAQVKFKIFRECLPLPESSLRHILKENYKGLKFKQELSGKQVKKLLSSFRPLIASSQPIQQARANVQLSQALPPSVPYLAPHRLVNPTLDHRIQSLPANGSFYVTNPQQPPYSRYRTMEERPSHEQMTHLDMRTVVEERAPRERVTIFGRHHHQLPLQRKPLHQDNNMVAHNNINPSAPAHHHELLLQRDTRYQNSVIAYNSNPAGGTQYTASVSQPQGQTTYHQLPVTYRDNAVAYNSYAPQPQPGISQGSTAAPRTLYYSYTAATHPSR